MSSRRSFLKLLGLAPAIVAVAKIPTIAAENVVSFSPIDSEITGLTEGNATFYAFSEPDSNWHACEGDLWFDTSHPDLPKLHRMHNGKWVTLGDSNVA